MLSDHSRGRPLPEDWRALIEAIAASHPDWGRNRVAREFLHQSGQVVSPRTVGKILEQREGRAEGVPESVTLFDRLPRYPDDEDADVIRRRAQACRQERLQAYQRHPLSHVELVRRMQQRSPMPIYRDPRRLLR